MPDVVMKQEIPKKEYFDKFLLVRKVGKVLRQQVWRVTRGRIELGIPEKS